MMKIVCLVCLLSVVVLVSSNPLGQLVQSCSACQPTSYNPASIPVVIQQPSNTNSYPQGATVQVPTAYSGPLGETLNQIILNRILSNPSLQKVIDPNAKLYNQNGEEVHRQVPSTGVSTPSVINNYFIVPPEFFNLNETIGKNVEVFNIAEAEKTSKRHRRKKLKKIFKQIEPSSPEDEEGDIVTKRRSSKRQRQHKSVNTKTRIDNRNESDDELDKSHEAIALKNQDNESNKRKHRLHKKKKERIPPPPLIEESDEVVQELEDLGSAIENRGENEVERPGQTRPKSKSKVLDKESDEIISEITKPNIDKDIKSSSDREKEPADMMEMPRVRMSKKNRRKESLDKIPDDKILGNIEIPTDISNKATPENRPTRDSKRNVAKKETEQKITNASRKQPLPNLTPFPDDVLNNFFPHMPMGSFYNPNTNNPYNFDQYYQYINPVRNSDANRTKKKRKNQNRKNNDENSNTRTIEIKLKPKKNESTTETPVVTTEKPKDVQEVKVSIEVEQSTESFEQVTAIPMEMPHKVYPMNTDEAESSSKESYETFSKLEDLHEFITPELSSEDEVPPMCNNGIINDYYPIFDVDVFYNPHAEKTINLEDDRFFYETGKEDKINRERRKLDRYEDSRDAERETDGKKTQTETQSKKYEKVDPDINKFDHSEYLDHISTFSDIDTPVHGIVKSNADIRREKVPAKNIRVKSESIETVSAGSKVAKYGVSSDTIEDSSSYVHNKHESENSSDSHTAYVVAKSLGRPEDYW